MQRETSAKNYGCGWELGIDSPQTAISAENDDRPVLLSMGAPVGRRLPQVLLQVGDMFEQGCEDWLRPNMDQDDRRLMTGGSSV